MAKRISSYRALETGLNYQTLYKHPPPRAKGGNQVSGGVSVQCLNVTPIANSSMETIRNSVKVKFGIKVITLVESLIDWEVPVHN